MVKFATKVTYVEYQSPGGIIEFNVGNAKNYYKIEFSVESEYGTIDRQVPIIIFNVSDRNIINQSEIWSETLIVYSWDGQSKLTVSSWRTNIGPTYDLLNQYVIVRCFCYQLYS